MACMLNVLGNVSMEDINEDIKELKRGRINITIHEIAEKASISPKLCIEVVNRKGGISQKP